ncbi:MAG: DUF805 domain-containing protein [Tannerella sp.]|jgi:uncharacterized membrane protein YhaH (DUF805 family)|nr:DUF805 domain-containing protein [Tannerella sp.]
MEWYLKVLRQYADFEGRARRTEYWMFVLFNVIVSFLISFVATIIMVITKHVSIVFLSCLYMFAMILPSLAVTVRRLHDTGRSAWVLFLNLIPFFGSICLFIFLILDGTPGRNNYGDSPKKAGYHTGFDRNKSVAVALIVSSFVWILSQLSASIIFNVHIVYILYCLVPIGLIAVGFLLLQEKKFTCNVAYALIITSVIWFIIEFYTFSIGYSNIFVMISRIQTLIIPAALMTLGISVLEKKDGGKVVAIMLIISFFLWFIPAIRGIIYHDLDNVKDCVSLMQIAMRIMIPVGFLPLAMFLLSRGVRPITANTFSQSVTSTYDTKNNGGNNGGDAVQNSVQDSVKSAVQNSVQDAVQNDGGKIYYERDNRGMRVDTFSQSVAYWMIERIKSPRKDPFVYYTFKNENDARAALLELPFIHVAADTGKLICDKLFRYGYYAVTNNEQFTGEYNAFISGADFTHDMWKQTHDTFSRYNGVKKNDLEPEKTAATTATTLTTTAATTATTVTTTTATTRSQPIADNAKKVTFVREDRDATSVWVIYKAPSKSDAMDFLSQQQIVRPLYYVIVETPEGNFGRDKDGFYQE